MGKEFKKASVGAGKVLFVMLSLLFMLWPSGPVRELLGRMTQNLVTGHRLEREWSRIARAPTRLGRDSVLIVEFLDYGCVYCSRAEEILDQFQNKWESVGVGVRVVSRGTLIGQDRAAKISGCGRLFGVFPDVHRALFEGRGRSGEELRLLARALGIPIDDLGDCMVGDRVAAMLREDAAWAERLGIRGTPFFVGRQGGFHVGLPTIDDLERVAGLRKSSAALRMKPASEHK